MNVEAIKAMEEFARTIIKLPEEAKNSFFESLSKSFNAEEIETLKKCVGIYRLMTTPMLYKAAKEALAEQLYKEFNA